MNEINDDVKNIRKTEYDVHPIILNRWSPRAMTSEKISEKELMTLFEAARWAPSSYNNQPWRFIYATRESDNWLKLFDLMVEFNQSWVKNASAVAVIISKKTFDHNGEDSITHSFDAGAAWQNLALQGAAMGLVIHGMQGFDYDKARTELKIPEGYNVEAMIAIGKRDKKESLPKPMQAREAPSTRKPLSDIVMEGSFKE
jgi:nitroreductase